MIKVFFFFSMFLFLSNGFANNELPRPLPDDSYPSDPYPYPYPEQETPYAMGSVETARFGTKTHNFSPRKNLNRIVRLSVVGVSNKNEIKSIRLHYADKTGSRNLFELTGKIGPGEFRDAYLDGRPIKKVEVVASGSHFWRKSGSFRIEVTALDSGNAPPRFDEEN